MYNFDQFLDRTLLAPVVKHEAQVFDMSSQMKNNNNNNKKSNQKKNNQRNYAVTCFLWYYISSMSCVKQ